MANHPNLSRVTVWPADVWAKIKRGDMADPEPSLYWTADMLWERERRNGFEIVGFVERGEDRGALVKNSGGLHYLMTPYGTSMSLPQHKVLAALAALNIST